MIYNQDWQLKHAENIILFLKYINSRTNDLILKGGTALVVCYELDRFSEDIDLDILNSSIIIESIISGFCENNNYKYRISKDTSVVKRYMINYGNISKPLKIEISLRRKNIDKREYTNINNFIVYTIDRLAYQKSVAYNARDRIRDLYDLCFICKKWWNDISENSKMLIQNVLQYKGLDHFDYIIQTQLDEFIDVDKLANDFLDMFDKFNLLFDNEEIKLYNEIKHNNLSS